MTPGLLPLVLILLISTSFPTRTPTERLPGPTPATEDTRRERTPVQMADYRGTWSVAILFWNQPAGAPLSGRALAQATPRLNGRYLISDVSGQVGSHAFEGTLIQSLQQETQTINAIWMDSFSSHPRTFQGVPESDGFSWTTPWSFPGAPQNSTDKGRSIWIREGEYLFQLFRMLPDGSCFKLLECRFSRCQVPTDPVPASAIRNRNPDPRQDAQEGVAEQPHPSGESPPK